MPWSSGWGRGERRWLELYTSTDRYHEYCREHELKTHPAPMQLDMVRFFVKMLTDEGDLVLDPFGGATAPARSPRSWAAGGSRPSRSASTWRVQRGASRSSLVRVRLADSRKFFSRSLNSRVGLAPNGR